MATQAYCVKDKMKVEMKNPTKITMKNGKAAMSGTCPKCGTKVFRIGGRRPPPSRPGDRPGSFPSDRRPSTTAARPRSVGPPDGRRRAADLVSRR